MAETMSCSSLSSGIIDTYILMHIIESTIVTIAVSHRHPPLDKLPVLSVCLRVLGRAHPEAVFPGARRERSHDLSILWYPRPSTPPLFSIHPDQLSSALISFWVTTIVVQLRLRVLIPCMRERIMTGNVCTKCIESETYVFHEGFLVVANVVRPVSYVFMGLSRRGAIM
jgi:hypothetical protein